MPSALWLGLLLCNIAWAINPTVAKFLVGELGALHTAWIKYNSALLVYLATMIALGLFPSKKGRDLSPVFLKAKNRRDLLAVVVIGIATCFISPLAQMFGLEASSAVNNAILVTFEPIFTVILGWLILGERIRKSHYLSFVLAVVGFLLLSKTLALVTGTASQNQWSASLGDLAILLAFSGEAVYSVVARRLTHIYRGASIFGTAMLVGAVSLTVIVLPWKGFPHLENLSWRGWCAILWLATCGTTLPYLYWLHALNRSLSLAAVVLSLFLQPLIGAVAGVVLLGESLDFGTVAGGLLILAAVWVQVIAEKIRTNGEVPAVLSGGAE